MFCPSLSSSSLSRNSARSTCSNGPIAKPTCCADIGVVHVKEVVFFVGSRGSIICKDELISPAQRHGFLTSSVMSPVQMTAKSSALSSSLKSSYLSLPLESLWFPLAPFEWGCTFEPEKLRRASPIVFWHLIEISHVEREVRSVRVL